jgi:putative endonuclease
LIDKKKEGKKGEEIAYLFYKKKGYKLLDRNFSSPWGEIDLIFKKGNLVVFVEVKRRKKGDFIYGVLSVNRDKIRKITNCAKMYLEINNLYEKCDVRFDVVVIEGEDIHVFENAFQC